MANYKIYGTNEPYTGNVVRIGQDLYTTKGGAKEGDSMVLVEDKTRNTPQTDLDILNQDVITPFIVGDKTPFGRGTYYYSNGTKVPNSTKLHHHTVIPQGRTSNFMTQHIMDGNDVDVFLTQSNNRRQSESRIGQQLGIGNRTSPRNGMRRNTGNNPGGNVGGGNTNQGGGTGGGGGGSY